MRALLASAAAATIVAAFVAWPQPVMTHGSTTTTVLFDREIVRILNERCVMCHAEGAIAFPLVTYEQTWLQGRSMRTSVLRRHMPPWSAVAGYGEFLNDNRLTLRETQFLVSWVEGLGPRNAGRVFLNVVDPAATPRPDVRATTHVGHWRLGQPDLVWRLPSQIIEADRPDGVARTVIDLGLSELRTVRALEFMPGDRRLVRAAVFSVSGTGQWLGTWTPWHGYVSLPDRVAYRLPAGTRILADIYYRSTDRPAEERGSLGLFLAPSPQRSASDLVIEAPVSTTDGPARTARVRMTADTTIWAIQPEIAASLTSLEVSVKRPGGATDVLLALTDPTPEWPTPYLLKTPRLLSAGSELVVVARARDPRTDRLTIHVGRY